MSRGLPYSIMVHVLGVALVFLFGNSVSRVQMKPPRAIRVQMVTLPQTQPREKPPEADIQPEVVPERRPEPEVELPPKELPKAKPVEKKPEEKKPTPEIKDPPKPKEADLADPADTKDDPAAVPQLSGPSVEGTDVDFPFAWYLARVQGQIARNWDPKQMGIRGSSTRCVVHFTIGRNGQVSRITLTQPSGIGVFDRGALRAVQVSSFPPLPPGFKDNSLGISMNFNLESGV